MSELNQKASIRQMPPGKLRDIKKIFEDGESSSTNKAEKPVPPARPPPPPTRAKSPVRQQPVSQKPHSKLPTVHQQQQASIAGQAAGHAFHVKDEDGSTGEPICDTSKVRSNSNSSDQTRDARKLSTATTARFTVSVDSTVPSQSGWKSLEKSASFSFAGHHPKPALRHTREHSCGDEVVVLDNSVYGSIQDKTKANTDFSDLYSKVNKPRKDTEALPRNVTFSPGDKVECSISRREAIKKNPEERRKTIADIEVKIEEIDKVSVNVAQRTKFFDGSKGDKPALPQKLDTVKRKSSMKTPKEFEDQQQNTFQALRKNNNDSEVDSLYSPPWDLSTNSVLEKLKRTQQIPPVVKHDTSNGAAKSVAPFKPPFSDVTQKKPGTTSQKSPSKENELVILRNQLKTKPSEPTSESSPKKMVAPPPKPPRTHAHDDYLRVKVSISQNSDGKPTFNTANQIAVRKTVNIMDAAGRREVPEDVEYLSVKDRISKMKHQSDTTSVEPPSQPAFSKRHSDHSVNAHNIAPSRPPPPKRRPSSGDHQPGSPIWLLGLSDELDDDGPIIIPVSPRNSELVGTPFVNMQGLHGRRPSDKLPPRPDVSQQSQRFPLRKSYSSECLHSSRGSSLNGDLEDEAGWGAMSRSSYDSQYEAVIDPDGYAVPNVFMRLPGKKRHSIKDDNLDVPASKFMTRLKGFSGDANSSPQQGSSKVTSAQEQNLDKVNKKKMIMVKQKINQAYADVDVVIVSESEEPDRDFQIVDQEQDVTETVTEPTVLKKRIDYCTSVRLKSSKSIRQCKEYLDAIYPQLFEYCLVVGLQPMVDAEGYQPYVIHKFPENVSSNLSVPNFCFPDATVFKPGSTTSSASESYSFAMTYADGSRVYGYCRRIQPSDSSLPEVICIISPIDAFNMYNTLLNEIEARRRISSDLASELIAAAFGRPLPKHGKVSHIRTLLTLKFKQWSLVFLKKKDINGDMETIFLNRSIDTRLENVNYESPLHYLGTDRLVKVFSSMLMERRIILCSSNLSVLTQTVHALSALLYPFQWQHVYIPLLPHEMLDVLCATVPFIVGVLSAFLPQVLKMEMEEVFIVDLDKKNAVKGQGDESTILPKRVQKALKTAINMCKIDAEARNAQWLMVAEAFLRMFIETIGHFNNHMRTQQDGSQIFQKENFILGVTSKEVREFLAWFTETQMFEVFILSHIEKSDHGTNDLFMQRLTEYKESKEDTGRNKGLGAKVKNFGKAIKTKLQS